MTHLGPKPRVANAHSARLPLSAFVISYNREPIIGTCLRALAFADEIVVIDKSSTDATRSIAATLADRVISVPWSPTVEETRAFAAAQCTHEWILFADDDECLSPEAIRFLDAELTAPRADVYMLPLRHHIMGVHDERAYYWPEYHMRCFRRGAVGFTDKVHEGTRILSNRAYYVPPATGACIHHLSHRDAAQFIEKTNRYTSRPDRRRGLQTGRSIARFAHERIDHWLAQTDPCDPDSYPEAVAVLRAVYDMIDRLKGWEEEAGHDGPARFAQECARLDAAYADELSALARPRASVVAPAAASTAMVARARLRASHPPAPAETTALAHAVDVLRESLTAQRDAVEAARLREADLRECFAALDLLRSELEARLDECGRHHETTLAAHAADAASWEAGSRAQEAACTAQLVALEATKEAANADLRDALAQALIRAEAAEHRTHMLETSTCWRVTAPLRAALIRLGR